MRCNNSSERKCDSNYKYILKYEIFEGVFFILSKNKVIFMTYLNEDSFDPNFSTQREVDIDNFFKFILEQVEYYTNILCKSTNKIVLMGHEGKKLDKTGEYLVKNSEDSIEIGKFILVAKTALKVCDEIINYLY